MVGASEVDLDEVIDGLGVGPWSILYFTVACVAPTTTIVNLLIGQFAAPPLEFTCTQTAPANGSLLSAGSSVSECEVASSWASGADGILATVPCTAFSYNTSMFHTTVTAEFDLVCSRSWYQQLFQLLFSVGMVIGAPIAGACSDMYGRQRTVFYGSVMMTLAICLLAVTPSLWLILTLRLWLGVVSQFTFNPSLTLGIEVCPTNMRTVYGCIESASYAMGLPLLAGIAYLCREWRDLQLYTSVLLLITVLLTCPCVMDESPRWLVQQGRLKEAERVIRRAARINGSRDKLPGLLQKTLQTTYEQEASEISLASRLWSLVSTSEMRRVTLVIMTLWFCEGVLCISLPLDSDSYRAPFLYMALLGMLEVPASLLMVPLGDKFGRLRVSVCSAIVTGSLLLAMVVIKIVYKHQEWPLLTLAIIVYMTMVGVSQMLMLLTSELFPTTVRSLGTSMGLLMACSTYNLPPLFKAVLPASMPWLLQAMNSALSFLSAALVLLLPETRRRPLLQTVDEHVLYTHQHQERRRQYSVLPSPT